MNKLFLTLFISTLYIIFLGRTAEFYLADVYNKMAQNELKIANIGNAFTTSQKAIVANRNEPKYYLTNARINLAKTLNRDDDEKNYFKDLALKDLKKAYLLNTENLATVKNSVYLYFLLATKNLSSSAVEQNIDPNYIEITKSFFKNAKIHYKEDVGVYTLIAKYEKRLGLVDMFNESKLNVEKLRPDLTKWHPSFN